MAIASTVTMIRIAMNNILEEDEDWGDGNNKCSEKDDIDLDAIQYKHISTSKKLAMTRLYLHDL